jgi:hypothetical protein
MMGTMSLKEIKAVIREAFAREGKDVGWVEEQLRALKKQPKVDAHEQQVFAALLHALDRSVPRAKRTPRRKRSAS